jgi:hypothetical protein
MTKQVIIRELSERHIIFVNYILSLSAHEFGFSFQQKWTAGQQMHHIYRCTAVLPLAFRLPKFLTGLVMGRATRPSRDYDELVQQYLIKLEKGATVNAIFRPAKVPYSYRIDLADKLVNEISSINNAIDMISEEDLDQLRLPHPILGPLSYREMLYFTMYHVDHHYALAKHYVSEI